jgi:stage II sporulation protein D
LTAGGLRLEPARGATSNPAPACWGRRRAIAAAAALAAVLAASCAPPQWPTPPAPPPTPAPRPGPPPAPGPPAETPRPLTLEGEPWIAIGLGLDLDTLTVVPRAPARIRSLARAGEGRWLEVGEAVTLRVAGSAMRLPSASRGGPEAWTLEPGDTVAIETDRPDEPAFGWKGRTWRGGLRVFANPRGRLTLVARLPLEAYLLGVVPGEIGALGEDLLEAGRAQTIAARSYTLFYMGRRAAEGFDLFATVEDQVYGPVESERPLATRCVLGTGGLVALSGGGPIRANYSSTCGGISAEVWEAWPVPPLPYLTSRRDAGGGDAWCAGSPHYRWREVWRASELASNLVRYAPAAGVSLPARGVGEIVDVRVLERSRSGRVWRLGIRTTRGDVVVHAHQLRQVLRRAGNASAILRSTLFKIDARRDRASHRVIEVIASGAGNGHGAGLCQTGALGMARAGRSAREILQHYYSGTEIARLY